MTDLSSLIARLEKAEGPSYSHDVEIAHLTGFWPAERIDRVTRADDGQVVVWFTEGPDIALPPAVTSSIDAAVSLAERVLPDANRTIRKRYRTTNGLINGHVYDAHVSGSDVCGGPNEAIALVLATLRALQQKGSSHE